MFIVSLFFSGRQQLLRLLVASVHVGDWCSVFNLVTARLDRQQWKGAAGRGLVAELSESMRPPFSTRFAAAFVSFLQLVHIYIHDILFNRNVIYLVLKV